MKTRPRQRLQAQPVAARSFLRTVDPRTKLVLTLLASAALMLPLPSLAIFVSLYGLALLLAGIGPHAARSIVRIRWLLVLLFVVDWMFVGVELAVVVTLRLALLVSASQIVLATTRPSELRRALEQLGMPERVAFSLGVAQRSLDELQSDLRRIVEAQRARGIDFSVAEESMGARLRRWYRHSLGLMVPAIVVSTQRAWAAHEAAAVRGFGRPRIEDTTNTNLSMRDYVLMLISVVVLGGLVLWR